MVKQSYYCNNLTDSLKHKIFIEQYVLIDLLSWELNIHLVTLNLYDIMFITSILMNSSFGFMTSYRLI